MKPYLIIFIAFILFISCKKASNNSASNPISQLPDTTHVGANTFGCLIDGKVYINNSKDNGANPGGLDYGLYLSENCLYIGAGNVISLNCAWPGVKGTYPMTNENLHQAFYWTYYNGTAITGDNEYKTDATHTGAVTITYYDSTIIAGTFYFDGVNDSGRVVHITDGRFDIKL